MKEQFDKRLVEKIKDSFQNHEEPFDPKQWEKFSKAYFNRPVQKRKWAYWPFWASGIAASLLLVFFFWPMEEKLKENVRTLTDSVIIKGQPFEDIHVPEVPLGLDSKDAGLSPSKEARPEREDFIVTEEGIKRTRAVPIEWQGKERSPDNVPAFSQDDISGNTAGSGTKNMEGEMLSETFPDRDEGTKSAQDWINAWKQAVDSEEDEPMRSSSNKMRLGLVVGPQTASNSTSGMNLGGGIMSEFSINDKLKLDIGVTYAQQRMGADNFNNLPEMMTMRAMDATSSYTNDYIESEYSLNYASLDIPINLKYKVLDKPNTNLFLITGLSSMVYLDQSTTETFSVQSNFMAMEDGTLRFEPAVQEFTSTYSPEVGQSNVDLGRMLNLSFGYEYQLKNGTFISLEPYYKVPLGNMTFANQQFSIGGMNLRMNFQFK